MAGWRSGIQRILAVVDTGFTGELKVSPKQASELGLATTHMETITLGNDKQVEMASCLAYVGMEGEVKEVSVLIAEGPAVIGVGLMKQFEYTLTIDFPKDSLVLKK